MKYPAHAIVVLGGGVHADGSLPRLVRNRVERAADLHRRRIAPRIIVSGRCGLMQDGTPPVTEAEAMAEYARSLGVSARSLLLEEESRDTLGNAYFVKLHYLEPNEWTSVRVVTSDFHLSRAAWVFRKILGPTFDFSFVSAFSGLSPEELIGRALEECKIYIFLNEWLQALRDGDPLSAEALMAKHHPAYAEAPTLTREQMQRRLADIARINRIAGGVHWLDAAGDAAEPVR